jgi:hypothetical protein
VFVLKFHLGTRFSGSCVAAANPRT